MLVQSTVVRQLYCYVLCLGWYYCYVLCLSWYYCYVLYLGRYYCYLSKYHDSVLSYCPVVCLVCGLCVSLCNGRGLPAKELSVLLHYFIIFIFMFVALQCKEFFIIFGTVNSC